MKWWWKSLIQFFNFYPSEKRGVLIVMGTLFLCLIFKRYIINQYLIPSEITLLDKIELFHPTYLDVTPCINFREPLTKQDFKATSLDTTLINNIIKCREKYGAFNCITDLLDVPGIYQDNLDYFKSISDPDFLTCLSININKATAEEISNFFRININKGKTFVKYRNSIGGFVKFEQIKQVYGFPKSKFKDYWINRIETGNVKIRKFNLKTATYLGLLKHGFINRKSAIVLNRYRKKRNLTLDDIRREVSDANKPLVIYYFKE